MSGWRPIETAPKNKNILLYGHIDHRHPFELLKWEKNSVFSGNWDYLDEAWVPHGATWEGPFMAATHWMPLPEPPK